MGVQIREEATVTLWGAVLRRAARVGSGHPRDLRLGAVGSGTVTTIQIELHGAATGKPRLMDVRPVEWRGVWAITPYVGYHEDLPNNRFTVTHVPTRSCTGSTPMSIDEARRVLAILAGLPDQDTWNVDDAKRIDKDVRRAAKRALEAALGRSL